MSYMSISGFFANAACGPKAHSDTAPIYRGDMNVLGVGQNDGFGLQARRRKVLKAECTCCT